MKVTVAGVPLKAQSDLGNEADENTDEVLHALLSTSSDPRLPPLPVLHPPLPCLFLICSISDKILQ